MNSLEFYKELKNNLQRLINVIIKDIPINKYCLSLSMTLKDGTHLIAKDLKRKLTSLNPIIPRIDCLPKNYTPGKKSKPIFSCVNSPTYLLSKWPIKK